MAAPLPFALEDKTTIEAMGLLEIQPHEIDNLPLQHFLKSERNEAVARKAHSSFHANRKSLITKIAERRRVLLAEAPPASARPTQEVLYIRHQAEVGTQQAATQQSTNDAIIKRLAIRAMRRAIFVRRAVETGSHVDELSRTHREQLSQRIAAAQTAADRRTFDPIERDIDSNLQDCYFGAREATHTVVDHDQKYQTDCQARRARLHELMKETESKVAEARRRNERQTSTVLGERQKRVQKTELRGSLIAEKWAERDRKLQARAVARDERAKSAIEHASDVVEEYRDKARQLLAGEADKTRVVQAASQKEARERIEKEKQLFTKRNEAAGQIFQENEKKIKTFSRFLNKRDLELEQRIDGQRTARNDKLCEGRIGLETKSAQVRQMRGQIDWEVAASRRAKLARSSLGLNDAVKQRAKSRAALNSTDETFAERRAGLMAVAPELAGLNERQQIRTLIRVIGCSEAEAREIVDAAKLPASLH
jgi:hypothetical protein